MKNFEFQKERYLSPEDKWAYAINAREKLWRETIKNAEVDKEIKRKLLETIDSMPMPRFGGIDFWARDLVDCLLNASGNIPKIVTAKDDTKALFESLRDDVYFFVADLKKNNLILFLKSFILSFKS